MTATSEHTPDALVLRFEGPDEFGDYNILSDADALAIAAVVSNMRLPAVTAAHTNRLVAAWNACAGIETEDLERGEVGGFVELEVTKIAACMETRADEAAALLKQSAMELEEAAKMFRGTGLPSVGDIMDTAAKRNRAWLDARKN